MRGFAILLVLSGFPALAEPPLTAEAFDALTLGQTMTWAEGGVIYGVERYLPDRRVLWTVLGDTCRSGHWYPEGEAICFVYEHDPAPDCWTIRRSGQDLAAEFLSPPGSMLPVTIARTDDPMPCFGPEVGA